MKTLHHHQNIALHLRGPQNVQLKCPMEKHQMRSCVLQTQMREHVNKKWKISLMAKQTNLPSRKQKGIYKDNLSLISCSGTVHNCSGACGFFSFHELYCASKWLGLDNIHERKNLLLMQNMYLLNQGYWSAILSMFANESADLARIIAIVEMPRS